MSVLYCKHCGAYNDDNINFCGSCGKPADKVTIVTENIEPTYDGSTAITVIPKKVKLEDGYFFKEVGFFKKLMIYALGVLITFIVAMIVFAYSNPKYFSDFTAYILRFFY